LFCGACEYNYYYETGDAGIQDAIANEDDMNRPVNVFTPDSKLQGQGGLLLQAAPAGMTGFPPAWPFIRDTPAVGGAQTLLDLATADDKPHVVTLSVGLTGNQPISALGGHTEVVALLNMGIGGVPIQAEVDVVQGFQWSAAISRLQVHFVYRTVPGGAGLPFPIPSYNIGASVSSDVVAHGRQPQRTLAKGGTLGNPALVPGTDEHWIVPAFSKSFRVVANPSNAQLTISLFPVLAGITPSAQYPLVAYPSVDLPIPSDAYYIVVSNAGLANVLTYRMIFDLAL
jgi:hypothetical protein